MIRLEALTKRYGVQEAVRNLSLHVPAGELFGFLGPNGAGKTTTIKMIAGLLRPTSGRIEIAGHDLASHPVEAKGALGFIPDRPFLYEKLSALEFMRFVAGIYGFDVGGLNGRIDGLLTLVELHPVRPPPIPGASPAIKETRA